ncbi:MAG: VOC family protein [Pseudomonadota bacterium]|nr:VOC family protein [Pseudomonadota bacterium]
MDPSDIEVASLVGLFVGVSLVVDDIDATDALLLEKGVTFSGPPKKQPCGSKLAQLKDPHGNMLPLLGEAG